MQSDIDLDLVVPTPLHARRLRQRRYNQSLLLVRELDRRRGWPVCANLLLKNVETVSQQGISSREREQDLRRVFQGHHSLWGAAILLVNDLMTTGATLRVCS